MTAERPVDVLRRAVLDEGGEWTTKRAVRVLDGLYLGLGEDGHYGPQTPTAGRARDELNRLVEEGLLVRDGKIGRSWTLTGGGGAAACRILRLMPAGCGCLCRGPRSL